MNRKTQCMICYELMKDPKILSCLHSLCSSCAEKLANSVGDVTCAFCMTVTSQQNVKQDRNLQELLEIRQQHDQDVMTQCAKREQHVLCQLQELRRGVSAFMDTVRSDKAKCEASVTSRIRMMTHRLINALMTACDQHQTRVKQHFEADVHTAQLRSLLYDINDLERKMLCPDSNMEARQTSLQTALVTTATMSTWLTNTMASFQPHARHSPGVFIPDEPVADISRLLLSPECCIKQHSANSYTVELLHPTGPPSFVSS